MCIIVRCSNVYVTLCNPFKQVLAYVSFFFSKIIIIIIINMLIIIIITIILMLVPFSLKMGGCLIP